MVGLLLVFQCDTGGYSLCFVGGDGEGGTSLVAGGGSSVTSTGGGGGGIGALSSVISLCGVLIGITSSPSSSGCCL